MGLLKTWLLMRGGLGGGPAQELVLRRGGGGGLRKSWLLTSGGVLGGSAQDLALEGGGGWEQALSKGFWGGLGCSRAGC